MSTEPTPASDASAGWPDPPPDLAAGSSAFFDRRQAEPSLSMTAAMDVQDQLLIVHHDMDRLRTLLEDAGDTLMENFHELSSLMFRRRNSAPPPSGVDRRGEGAAPVHEPVPQPSFEPVLATRPDQDLNSVFNGTDFAESQLVEFDASDDEPAVPQREVWTDAQRAANRQRTEADRVSDRERVEALMLRIVTALQFQDMANQLITHASNRLRSSADRIARDIMREEGEDAFVEDPPMRPNPVTQDEMDAGSIDLF